MVVFAIAIFLSAFLLFQVQPLMGKFILPWFGSAAGVWTTALLLFQLLLLVGYAYAHLLQGRLKPSRQAALHLTLLAVALAFLPVIPSDAWKPQGGGDPTWRILLLLCATVGLPFVLLSSTAPLFQRWFAHVYAGRSPYRLYAVSNAGSLLALISYPFFFERLFRLKVQAWTWSAGFLLLVVLAGLAAWIVLRHTRAHRLDPDDASHEEPPNARHASTSDRTRRGPGASSALLWVTLSALGSLMLLATLNQMTADVPAVPFLFVLPLSLYLLTFIIAFDHERWYSRPVFCVLLPLALAGAVFGVTKNIGLDLYPRISLYALALFACCMSCHGELARSKPDPEHLTLFYMMVAVGGALGGLFVAVLAPQLFDGYWEYPIGLAATYGLVMFWVGRDLLRQSKTVVAAVPSAKKKPDKTKARRRAGKRSAADERARGMCDLLLRLGWATEAAAVIGLVALVGGFTYAYTSQPSRTIARARDFYGVVEVSEAEVQLPRVHKYNLMHGHARHGFQYRHPQKRTWPTTYYGRASGVGLAILHHPKRNVPDRRFRIGLVGLGPGTISVYANDEQHAALQKQVSDYQRYYEINPQVVNMAAAYFTFLDDARARGAEVDIVLGDARVEMQRELEQGAAQEFDVLAIDAFSGGAVPMHLLTRECFEVYFAHLKPDGILAIHTSSRYLNLLPVVRTVAESLGKSAYFISAPGDQFGNSASRWVLITDNADFLSSASVRQAITPLRPEDRKFVLWTDDFSSLFDVIE